MPVAASSVTLNCGRKRIEVETAAALALEVVDDGGVTRNRRRAARSSGDDGIGVAGLDAVRRKTVLRRDETEPARALLVSAGRRRP